MKIHNVNLYKEHYQQIASGQINFDVRINHIQPGDIIIYHEIDSNGGDTRNFFAVRVKVKKEFDKYLEQLGHEVKDKPGRDIVIIGFEPLQLAPGVVPT